MVNIKIFDNTKFKLVRSENYNFNFNKETGAFQRWGKTIKDDPTGSISPEILDLEISDGEDCIGCEYCYKANGPGAGETHNLTFEDFKTIFHKMPPTLTQIAFGIMNISTNPDFFPMMEYARSKGVIPNYTTNGFGVTKEIAERTASICGAVAVSCHQKETAYNAIKKFTDAGMTQVNVHQVLHAQNYEQVLHLLSDRVSDPRLAKLNAVVFLAYKPKGTNAGAFTRCSVEQYRTLIEFCEIHGVSIGFDSCSAPAVFKAYEQLGKYEKVNQLIEPCESSCFSSYINCRGEFFPCSFAEGEKNWETGISVLEATSFVSDVWNHERVVAFRNRLQHTTDSCSGCIAQSACRYCPLFTVTDCHTKYL